MFETDKPIIGMLHLPPLPGAPGFGGTISTIWDTVLGDLEALLTGGVHGLMIENYGDVPFYPGRVTAMTVAHMTAIANEMERTQAPASVVVLLWWRPSAEPDVGRQQRGSRDDAPGCRNLDRQVRDA